MSRGSPCFVPSGATGLSLPQELGQHTIPGLSFWSLGSVCFVFTCQKFEEVINGRSLRGCSDGTFPFNLGGEGAWAKDKQEQGGGGPALPGQSSPGENSLQLPETCTSKFVLKAVQVPVSSQPAGGICLDLLCKAICWGPRGQKEGCPGTPMSLQSGGQVVGEGKGRLTALSGMRILTSVREDEGKEGRRSSTLPMSFRRVSPTFWGEEEAGGCHHFLSGKATFPLQGALQGAACPVWLLLATSALETLAASQQGRVALPPFKDWDAPSLSSHPFPGPWLSPSPLPHSPRGAAGRAHS